MSDQSVKTRSWLRDLIVQYFSDSELRELCFDLGIEYESLPGDGKTAKTRELVALVWRTDQVNQLIEACQRLRPNVDWRAGFQTSSQTHATTTTPSNQAASTGKQNVDRKSGSALGYIVIPLLILFVAAIATLLFERLAAMRSSSQSPATTIPLITHVAMQPTEQPKLTSVAISNTPTTQAPAIAHQERRLFTLVSVAPVRHDDNVTGFRLTIEINGERYSYPTRSVWADPDSPSLPFSFPMEQTEKYDVYFSGFLRLKDGTEMPVFPQPIDRVQWQGQTVRRTYENFEHFTITYEISRD